MAAVATLPTTTFAADVGEGDTIVSLVSVDDVRIGMVLSSGAESMAVTAIGPSGLVSVRRGVLGTATRPHAANDVLYIGRGDQFYEQDPIGAPPTGPMVAPWVNVTNGNVWWPIHSTPNPTSGRWVLTQTTYTTGPFGVQTITVNPTVTGTYTAP